MFDLDTFLGLELTRLLTGMSIDPNPLGLMFTP